MSKNYDDDSDQTLVVMNGSVVVVGQVPAPVPSRSGNVFVECNAQEENTLCYPMTTGCQEEVGCGGSEKERSSE